MFNNVKIRNPKPRNPKEIRNPNMGGAGAIARMSMRMRMKGQSGQECPRSYQGRTSTWHAPDDRQFRDAKKPALWPAG
jgi:hypothetical protein